MKYKAWILCRVSDKDQVQGISLESQEADAKRMLTEQYGVRSEEIMTFREIFTGRKNFRPVFERLMAFSKEHQKTLQYGCIFDIDRFSRAGAGFYESSKDRFKALGIQLIDTAGVIQPERNMLKGTGGKFGVDFEYEWSRFSPSETAEIQRAQEAKQEVRKILLRTVRPQIQYVQEGYQTRRAPYGFKNIKIIDRENGKKRAILKIEPSEARYLTKMYTYGILVLQGVMTSKQVCNKMNTMGYRSRELNKWNEDRTRIIGKIGGKKLNTKQFWKYLKNPKYAGFNYEKWTGMHLVKSKSSQLIDIDIWNKANADKYKIIKDKNSPTGWRLLDLKEKPKRAYKKIHPDYLYKGLISCPKCEKPLKTGASTGKSGKRFPLYFCNRQHKQISINPKKLDTVLKNFFQNLTFSDKVINLFEIGVKKHLITKLKNKNLFISNIDEKINQLHIKAEGIYKKLEFLSNGVLIQKCEQDYENVLEQIALLESNQTQKQYTEEDIIQMVDNVKRMVEHLDKLPKANNQAVISGLWNCTFPVLPTLEELERRTPKVSIIVQLTSSSKTKKELWYTIREQSRTLFKEIIHWNEILTKISEYLENIQD